MPRSKPIEVVLGHELETLVRRKCSAEKVELSTVVRRFLSKWVGRSELAKAVKRGRPWGKEQ